MGESQVSYDVAQLDAPVLLDPGMTANVVTATCRVWRGPANTGTTWSTGNALSRAFDGGTTPCTSTSALVRSIAAGGPVVSSGNTQWAGSTVIYAGMSGTLDGGQNLGGHVFVTTAANTSSSSTAWIDLKASPVTNDPSGFNPAGFDVSALAVDPHDATGATVYATILGFGEPHLYRSTDFGANWTNVSADLPDAPANAVVVDPNDTNTVYVALDTGVYVTTAVATCATTNCWSPLGTGLPNSPVTSLVAGTSLPTGDGRVGLLRAGTYGRGIWSTPLLTSATPVAAAITVSPQSLVFAATAVNATSAPQTVTVTSSGNIAVTIGTPQINGNFAITADTCSGQTLASGTSCTVGVAFVPVVLGPATGTLSIPSTGGTAVAVALSGNGAHPATDTLSSSSLTFAAQPVNTPSAAQTVTLTNSGDVALAISSIASSNPQFVESDNCGSSLAAQSTCTLSVIFTPTASGVVTGSLSVQDAMQTQTISLSGTGFVAATDTLSPTSLAFGSQKLGTSSPAQTVTLTNSGDVALSLTSIASSSSEFAQSNNCGTSLAAHSSCAISLLFTPTVSGTRTASLIVVDGIQTQTVTLTGVGYASATDALAPMSLTFSSQAVNTTSAAQAVTLTNSGDVPLAITSITASPAVFALSNGCGISLAAHSSCTLSVTFTPASNGVVGGSLTVTDTLQTQSVALSGTGYVPATATLSTNSITFASQQVGTTSSPRNITLTNSGDVPLAITGITSSSIDFPESNTCSSALAARSSCTITVSFSPSTPGLRTGSVTLIDANGTQSIALTGQGLSAPGVTLTPANLNFGTVLIGTTGAAQTLLLTNNGGTDLNIASALVSASFTIASTTCGATLTAGATCTYSLTFTPPASGAYTGSFTLTDNAASSPQVVLLAGTGTTPASLTFSAASLSFPSTATGSTSAPQTLTLSNTGGLPVTLSGINVSANFSISSNTCGSNLAAGAACVVGVIFTPTISGTITGTLTVSNSASPALQTVALSGTGLAPASGTLAPTTLTFAAQVAGITSAPQTVTLTNSGDLALSLSGLSSSSPSFVVADGCGASLAAHSTCLYSVTFSSASTGTSTGVLSVTAAGRALTVSLTGTTFTAATDTLSTTSLSFAAQAAGSTSSPQAVVLTNNGDVALSITSITTSSAEFGATGTCGASLAAHSACTINATFTPSTAGTRSGSLVITDALHAETVSLTGAGYLAATDTLSATSLSFASQQVNTTSAAQTLTLTNSGDVALTISSLISSSTEFAVASTCGVSLAAHANCALTVTFTPSAAGSRSGNVTLVDSAHTQTIALTGTATSPPSLVLSPTALGFPATIVNQTSATEIITLSNTGGGATTPQSPAITGDFAITNNTCTGSLQPNTGCSIAITFTPTATGTRSGTISIGSSAGAQTATLTGTGNAPATDTLTPLALTFALQSVGTTSAGQQVTLTNTGDVPLTLISASTSTAEFGAVNACGTSLAAHATCAIVVTFTPTATGTRTGTLTVSDAFRSQTVVLNGTGNAAAGVSLSPASLSFAATGVGLISVAQAATLTNNGGSPLNITSVAVSAGFAISANSCGAVLAVGASCSLQIVSVPGTAGPYAGSLTLVTNATPSTQTVSLVGTGVDFTLIAAGATSQTVSSGGTATYPLQLSSLNSLSGAVALTCAGAPADSHCIVTPSTGALGSTQSIAVTVTTGVAALDPAPVMPWMRLTRRGVPVVLALGMPFLWPGRRRRRFSVLSLAMLLSLACAGTIGCGAGRALPPGATTVNPYQTPNGTYTLTVTGSAAGVSHTVLLTLIVQ